MAKTGRDILEIGEKARANPDLYKWKVFFLALAGYAYIFGIILLLLLFFIICGALVVILKRSRPSTVIVIFAISILALLGSIIKTFAANFLLRQNDIDSVEIKRDDAPALFSELDSIGATLGAPSVKRVFLTLEHDASVVDTPLLGILGWHRHNIYLGYSLMASLRPDEFRAILAHEYGHIIALQNKVTSLTKRMFAELSYFSSIRTGFASSIFIEPFYDRYIPFLYDYMPPVCRLDEFEADATAARLTSPAITASMLSKLNASSHYLEKIFWERVFMRAERSNMPDTAPYSVMLSAFASINQVDAEKWLAPKLSVMTRPEDTHPSLIDRLNNLHAPASALSFTGKTAAESLLAKDLPKITKMLNDKWRELSAHKWNTYHDRIAESRLKLERAAGKTGELDAKGLLELAMANHYLRNNDETDRLCSMALEKDGGNYMAHYMLAFSKIDKNDDACLVHAKEAAKKTSVLYLDSTVELLLSVSDYLEGNGRLDEAEEFVLSRKNFETLRPLIAMERGAPQENDVYAPHGLPRADVDAIVGLLRQNEEISEVYVARKKVAHLPDTPHIAIGYRRAKKGFKLLDDSESFDMRVSDEFYLKHTDYTYEIFALRENILGTFMPKFRRAEGCVFKR